MYEVIRSYKVEQNFMRGILLTFFISVLASILARLPFFSIIGQLILAILLGVIWKSLVGVTNDSLNGITFSSQKLLRLGIILLGTRLNLSTIFHAGLDVFILAFTSVFFTVIIVYLLAKLLKINDSLAILTACGTAICGAAAVMAISSQLKAKVSDTTVAAAVVSILGTGLTIIYHFSYSNLSLSATQYGILSGATLHEVAHVIAASTPIGQEAVELAIVTKLTRVALLIPVALIISLVVNGKNTSENKDQHLPIPWFIVGFLLMGIINSLGLVSTTISSNLIMLAYILIGMAMAGLGLNIHVSSLSKKGKAPFLASLIGSVLLVIVSWILIRILTI